MRGAEYAAVVLAGGTGARLGGADKAAVRVGGRTLLDHCLAAVADAAEVVVVGPPQPTRQPTRQPTARPVIFTLEEPPGGGPAAGLLAGRDALRRTPETLVVLAVDMPFVAPATIRRLRGALAGTDVDAAFLVDGDGRRQLAGALTVAALDRRAAALVPTPAERRGLPVHVLFEGLAIVAVPAVAAEATDLDTWGDVSAARAARTDLRARRPVGDCGAVNLHDWIDELCDVLDIETEVDEALVLDLARVAAHDVERRAAPITTYLLGYAAGSQDADPAAIEVLAAKAQTLADEWDRPADAPDPDDVDDEIPDDSTVDHTGDRFED